MKRILYLVVTSTLLAAACPAADDPSMYVEHHVKDAATHEMLRAVADEADPLVRLDVLEAFAVIRDTNDLDLVRARLRDPVAVVRVFAEISLNLNSQSNQVVTTVEVTLRDLPDANAQTVIARLRDHNVVVQEEAVRAAQRESIPQAIPVLLAMLENADSSLRSVICEALGKLQSSSRQANTLADVVGALVRQIARDDDPFVRRAAGVALVAIHDESAKLALLKLLDHERAEARYEAATALGKWSDAALAASLHRLLDDPVSRVAAATAEALGRLKNPESVAPLVRCLANGPASVQERIAWAMGEFRATDAVPLLNGLLKSGDVELEITTARALGQIGDERALPALRKALVEMKAHPPVVRQAAIESLRQLADRESLKRVVQFVNERVVPPLPPSPEPTYDQPDVRNTALRFVAELGDAAVAERMLAALRDTPQRPVRPVLAETMNKLTGKHYRSLPDQDYRRYFVESLGATSYNFLPPPPGVTLEQLKE